MHNVQRDFILVLLIVAPLAVSCQPIQPPTPVPISQTEAAVTNSETATSVAITQTLAPVTTEEPTTAEVVSVTEGSDSEANRLLQEGDQLHEAGQYEKAVTAFTQAIQLDPNRAEAYVKRAAAYLRLGEFEAAVADCDTAIQLRPDFADAYLYRGAASAYLGEFDAAVLDLTEAILRDPSSVNAHVYRGASYFFLEQYAAAVQDCTDAVRLSGGYFLPAELCLNVMGTLISPEFEHLEAAIQDYDEAIRLNPDAAAAYMFRGLTQRTLGDIEASVRDLEAALQLDPFLGDLLTMYWSSAYWGEGDPAAAITEIEAALALVDPDSVLARIIEIPLERLRSNE